MLLGLSVTLRVFTFVPCHCLDTKSDSCHSSITGFWGSTALLHFLQVTAPPSPTSSKFLPLSAQKVVPGWPAHSPGGTATSPAHLASRLKTMPSVIPSATGPLLLSEPNSAFSSPLGSSHIASSFCARPLLCSFPIITYSFSCSQFNPASSGRPG